MTKQKNWNEQDDQDSQQPGGEAQNLPAWRRVTRGQVYLTGGSLLASGVADAAMHFDKTGVFFTLLATGVIAGMSNEILDHMVPGRDAARVIDATSRVLKVASPTYKVYADQSAPAKLRRLIGKPQRSDLEEFHEDLPEDECDDTILVDADDLEDMEDLQPTKKTEPAARIDPQDFQALLKALPKSCTLSQVVTNGWHPTRDQIFLGFLTDGSPVFVSASRLCHVALAGATDGGKSSIMRLLMAQLCHVGCKVLLLNPHYTRYDRDSDEDWTPFEPYLMRDPMECKDFKVIGECLKHAATVLLPKRIERRARGQHVGDPYFIVLDELPAIIDEIPDAPKYLGKLLRQGRKFGIFLISASQDFLVKTIDPKGTGSGVRECYRTAFYVGGDTTTGKALLDITSVKEIPEEILGKGVVMLRGASPEVKKAILVRVPFLDNAGLYYLLGPSTYNPDEDYDDEDDEDELFGRQAGKHPALPARQGAMPGNAAREQKHPAPAARTQIYEVPRQAEKSEAQADEEEVDPADMAKAFVLWQAGGDSVRELTTAAKAAGYGWSNGYCRRLIRAMKRHKLIQTQEEDAM